MPSFSPQKKEKYKGKKLYSRAMGQTDDITCYRHSGVGSTVFQQHIMWCILVARHFLNVILNFFFHITPIQQYPCIWEILRTILVWLSMFHGLEPSMRRLKCALEGLKYQTWYQYWNRQYLMHDINNIKNIGKIELILCCLSYIN